MEKIINYHNSIWQCASGCKDHGQPYQFVACSPANCGDAGKYLVCPKCQNLGLILIKQNLQVRYSTKLIMAGGKSND